MKRLLILLVAAAAAACHAPESDTLNVMTFNMRYDNPDDESNNWRFRRERVAEVITSHAVDVFGAQELLVNQRNDLAALLPDYEYVGVGREDGADAGEFNPVFFRRDRFTLLDSGTFWLSETPEVAGSKGWDGACERIATWVVLRDGEREFLFINTHLDHVGRVARDQGIALLLERIDALRGGRPVILTGDFNSTPESSVIAHVQQSGILHDVKGVAAETAGTAWSFADFGEIPEEHRPLLDYIFVNDALTADRYEVLPDRLNGGYVSDHAPVMAVVRFAE